MARKVRPTTVGEAARALDELAPPALAQAWDNVGLLAGDREAVCRRVLLCIDLMPAVLEEAIAGKADLIVAYHPPIFKPVSRLIAQSDGPDALVHRAIRTGIAIYSSHTALDAAEGGTNDVMAGLCGLSDVQPFEYVSTGPRQFKLVTFVPEAGGGETAPAGLAGEVPSGSRDLPGRPLQEVAEALFAAGAGRIGDYEQCSFRLSGEGTFFGTEGTSPRVGRRGRLERVSETRLEVVVPAGRLPEVVAALRRAHPYEEPAFDVYPLEGEPAAGIGRVGSLPDGTTLGKLAAQLKKATGSRVAMMVGAPGTRVRRAAVCVGAAGRLPLEKPRSADADVIVTGEIRHHDALTLLRLGKCAVALGHWESERPALAPLGRRLVQRLPGLRVMLSRREVGPLTAV